MSTAYCMKCRKKVEIKDSTRVVLKNGAPALSGTCPDSGTKVFRFVKRRLDPVYVLELGLKREREGQEFYLQAVNTTEDPDGKAMFKWLAKMEKYHADKLDLQLKSLLGKEGWLEFKELEAPLVEDEFPRDFEGKGTYAPSATEVSALKKAIKAEQKSIEFYSQNQAITTEPFGKAMFASLVKEEEGHLIMLQKQLDWLGKNRTYFKVRRFLQQVF